MKRVLVADPDCSFLKTVGMLLREEFDISHARTPNAVLRKAKEMQPDVIILGCFEPRGQSFTLHNMLRKDEHTASIPILVIDVPPRDHLRKGWKRSEGLQMQAEGYLSRPLDARTLRREVRRVMESRSAGMLSWAQILEQTEQMLLEEVYSWNDTQRHNAHPDQGAEPKSVKRQPAALQI
jgi:putative two-component system response regulator